MRPRVLLDVDEVIADFNQGLRALIFERMKINVRHVPATAEHLEERLGFTLQQKKDLHAGMDQPGWNRTFQLLPGAKAGVERLQEVADVFFVTAPRWSSPTWDYDRRDWLHAHLGIPERQVVITSAKHTVCGDMFVDDKPSNVQEWRSAWPLGTAFLWDRPHNQTATGLIRAYNWSGLYEMAVNIKKSRGSTWVRMSSPQ